MSRFTEYSGTSFFKETPEIWAKSMGSDAIALNISKELARRLRMFHADFGEIKFLK